MKKNNKIQSGSALIITLLVVSVLVAVGFSVSRITMSEIVQSTELEDSELAYQAAEAGVEIGLLLYRYDRDAQVPDETVAVTAITTDYLRYNITDATEMGSSDAMDATKSYFDMKMYHRNTGNKDIIGIKSCDKRLYDAKLCVKVDTCPTDITCYEPEGESDIYYIIPALIQDQAVEYNIYDSTTSLNISWVFLDDENVDDNKLLILPIDSDGQIVDNLKQLLTGNIGDNVTIGLTNSDKTINKIRIKPFGGNLASYEIGSIANFDSRYTIIESTGYFGSTKRKLKVELDRATGSILSPYDFTVYSGI